MCRAVWGSEAAKSLELRSVMGPKRSQHFRPLFPVSFVAGMVKKQGLLRMSFGCVDLELDS